MASVIHVEARERKVVDVAALRARMSERGITQREFAEAAGFWPEHVSTILNGKAGYLGARRIAKIEQAMKALGLDKPDEAASA